ncbi:MAG: hypothetical protein AAFX06_16945 [Planctomycetota bacterium]
MTEPSLNPYAAPETTGASHPTPASGRLKWLTLAVFFTLVRGIGFGFATMILWVHLSGTAIKWHNAVPMLLGILLVCLIGHFVESRAGERAKPLTVLAMVTYLAGFVVSTLMGFTGSYPTPF